jgi:hypothetical protein
MKIHWLLTNQNPGFLYQVKLKIKCIVGAQLSKVLVNVDSTALYPGQLQSLKREINLKWPSNVHFKTV